MRNAVVWMAVGIALGTGCVPSRPQEGAVELKPQALDFATGTLNGSVVWNGELSSLFGTSSLIAVITGLSTRSVAPNGAFTFPSIAVGTHTVAIYSDSCATPSRKLGEAMAVVTADNTTSTTVDITAGAGYVRGQVTVDGAILPNPVVTITGYCGLFARASDGRVAQFLPAGSYTANVAGPSGIVGTTSFVVTAGQVTDLGVLAFTTGRLSGAVLWNGSPASGLGANSMAVEVQGLAAFRVPGSGTFEFSSLPPGAHQLSVFGDVCRVSTQRLGTTPVTVQAGQTATADVDITAMAGKVTGRVATNGIPLPQSIVLVSGLCTNLERDAAGRFAGYLRPGTYTASIQGPSGRLHSVTFSVSAGQTTDLGTIDVATGQLGGRVRWFGEYISGLGVSDIIVSLPGLAFSKRVGSDGRIDLPELPAGSHALVAYSDACFGPSKILKEMTVVSTAGQTGSFDLDIVAGRVDAVITTNGVPLPQPVVIAAGDCQAWGRDATGHVSHYLKPGSYTMNVSGPSGKIGDFPINVEPGVVTDTDLGHTPVGADVTVELSGGIESVGGVNVTFNTVTAGGTTSVIESGSGPPPPSGYRIVGLKGQIRYWDIDSSAGFTGEILVCIHYDEAEIQKSETSLRLVHDGGSGWEDITSSLDLEANVVCGHTTSLSPFAVVEPLPDQDGDGTPDADDNCPAAANPGQADTDGDGRGDVCDTCPADATNDTDADGVCGDVDNCPLAANSGQGDSDSDGIGDACDDSDADGVMDDGDNCPTESNRDQADSDADGRGDACDACADDAANDADGDQRCANVDNCPLAPNQEQQDLDADGAGDVCDEDDDGDTVVDGTDRCPATAAGQRVDQSGCSIADLCPCAGPWPNHGAYVSCVSQACEALVAGGRMTPAEQDAEVTAAARSSCGRK